MATIKHGTVKRIHVDKRIIAQNAKRGENAPALTIQTSKGSFKARQVIVDGHVVFCQRVKPLSCGARVYAETTAEVDYYL